jgi:hypothetical protein
MKATMWMTVLGGGKPFDWYLGGPYASDSNTGKSYNEALATVAAVEARLTAGARVGVVPGSYFREQLTIAHNNVSVKWLTPEPGNEPKFDCSNLIAAGAWTKTGGQTNVYQATVAIEGAVSKTWVSALEDNTRLTRAVDLAACDATAGSYFPSSDATNGNITLYVHASDNSDPAASGKVYAHACRKYGLFCYNVTGTQITGIETRRNLHDDGSMSLGRSTTVTDCVVRDGTKHNMLAREGCVLDNVELVDAYYYTNATLLVLYDFDPTGLDVIIKNCHLHRSAYASNYGGFFSEVGGVGYYGTVTYDNCQTENIGTAFSGGLGAGAVGLNIINCTASGGSTGIRVDTAAPCTIAGCNMSGTSDRIVHLDEPSPNVTIAGCTFTSLHSAPNVIYSVENGVTLNVSDTVLSGNGDTSTKGVNLLGTGKTVTIQRCTMTDGINAIANLLTGETLNIDYNTYKTGMNAQWNGVWTPFVDWQAATGQDAHSTVG